MTSFGNHHAHFAVGVAQVFGGSEVFLTVSSSSSLSSPLCLLWRKALALPDLAILILASLAFWAWEEEEGTASDRVGGRSQKMTNALFNGENLPTHQPSSVVIFTATTVLILINYFKFYPSHRMYFRMYDKKCSL